MNYNEYYARQAGGALPYFAGAQYQRGLMHGLLTPGVRARKRIKRAPAKKGGITATRRRKRRTSAKRETDIFDDDFST